MVVGFRRFVIAAIVLLVAACAREHSAPATPAAIDPFREAEASAVRAARGFDGANRLMTAYLAKADPATGLLPQYLHPIAAPDQSDLESIPAVWSPSNTASDLYPFLAIAAYLTDDATYAGSIKTILAREKALTATPGGLVRDYRLDQRRALDEPLPRLIFNAAEYVKDGLVPLLELTGDPDFLARARELTDAILAASPVSTSAGRLPAEDAETSGDLMQSLYRLYPMTGDRAYLDALRRLGDAWFTIVLPGAGGLPVHAWNFGAGRPHDTKLLLRDHGNEVVLGLALTYAALAREDPAAADRYRPALQKMLARLAAEARTKDGFFVNAIDTATGKAIDGGLADTWGYVLCAYAIDARLNGNTASREPIRKLLAHLDTARDYTWEVGIDGLADATESAIYLENREPDPRVRAWVRDMIDRMLTRQGPDGIVEGTYLDGNWIRTVLLATLMETAGARLSPWRRDARIGAAVRGDVVHVVVHADSPFAGRLRFDRPRWRDFLKLPENLPRLNEWPVWWAAESGARYRVETVSGAGAVTGSDERSGADLIAGLPVTLAAGETLRFRVARVAAAQEPSKSQ
jgi:rhamnogalacturonyl hydrolase YesR